MKTAMFLAGLGVVGTMAISSNALSCSYFIHQIGQKNDLAAATASHLNVSLEDVTSLRITEYRFWESIPTPMCPEEITHEATIELTYNDVTALVPTVCDAKFKATKLDNWESNTATYRYDELHPRSCVAL